MRKDKNFIKKIIDTFPERKTDKCFSVSELVIDYIQDDDATQRCYFTEGNREGFKINNKNKIEINLFSIDGCFFADDDTKRCDGIVFDEKEICFFELKLNVISNKGSKKRERFNDAINQLENTITYLKNGNENKVAFCELMPEAFICMNNKSYPSNKASINQKKVKFLDRNKIPLYDKNEKTFE